MNSGIRAALAAALAVVPCAAFAHSGSGGAAGFIHGFAHPLGGPDHVLAMVAIGLIAANLGGRALWLVPGTFVLMMALGGAFGATGVALPSAELAIALSVIVLGLAVATRTILPTLSTVALAGIFAIFHGHAHGAEMSPDSSWTAYAAGFLTTTVLLHAAGIGIGIMLNRLREPVLRGALAATGGAMVLAGFVIILWSSG
jgi:urease accessory protein